MKFKDKVNFINDILDHFNNDYNKARGYISRCYIKGEINGSEELELMDILYKFKKNNLI